MSGGLWLIFLNLVLRQAKKTPLALKFEITDVELVCFNIQHLSGGRRLFDADEEQFSKDASPMIIAMISARRGELTYFLPSVPVNNVQMKAKSLSIKVSPAIGSVSAECVYPEKSKCIMTLAHGAGAGMNHAFMVSLAQSLFEQGITTLRFNFPFAENKKGRPDAPAIAHQTIEAAIVKTQKLFPGLPLFVAGKSFGGRMTSQYLSEHPQDAVTGVVFYGFPLHPPGKPAIERAEHLKKVKSPMLFLQGSKDELATWNLIESVCSSLPRAELVRIEGANHAFRTGKQDIIKLLATLTKDWIVKMIKKTK